MTHYRLSPSFFQAKYLTILSLMVVSLLSFGLSQSYAQTTITLDTSTNSYGPNDLVKVNGHVADSSNKLIAIEVKDPSSHTLMVRTVKTDGSGNFVLEFKLPSTSQAGNYHITANANVDGNTITQTKEIAETATVPEFSSMSSMILVASTILILMLSIKIRPGLQIMSKK